MRNLEILMGRWKKQSTGLEVGRSEQEIRKAFAKAGGRATEDVIQLYSACGGMAEMENDALWRLWTLEEIVEGNAEKSEFGVLFSDHLMHSWCYRLKENDARSSSVYIDLFMGAAHPPPKKIFDTVEDFFAAFVSDPDSILG